MFQKQKNLTVYINQWKYSYHDGRVCVLVSEEECRESVEIGSHVLCLCVCMFACCLIMVMFLLMMIQLGVFWSRGSVEIGGAGCPRGCGRCNLEEKLAPSRREEPDRYLEKDDDDDGADGDAVVSDDDDDDGNSDVDVQYGDKAQRV